MENSTRFSESMETIRQAREEKKERIEAREKLIKPLLELGLERSICYKLARAGIFDANDIYETYNSKKLFHIKNIREKTINEILAHVDCRLPSSTNEQRAKEKVKNDDGEER